MRTVVKGPKVTWINIQNPTEKDVEFLRETYTLHPVILKEIVPPSWRAKVEVFPNYLFLVLHHPAYSKETKKTRPRELDIIVTKDTIITIHYSAIVPVKALLDKCNLYPESKKLYMAQTSGHLLYYLLDRFWEDCLTKISRINTKITNIEEQIFENKESEMVKEISLARADVLDFARIITPQQSILQSLSDTAIDFFGKDIGHYFSNIMGNYARCKNELETQKESVSALEETNNSLLNKKINEIIKLLTIFSVIVFPLTLFAGIFGMNTDYLPLVGQPNDFWIISGIMLSGIFIMIFFFRRKGWM